MNALVSHPDVMKWVLWSWRSKMDFLGPLFDTIYNGPIDITITNSTITIFKDCVLDVSLCPPTVQTLYNDLRANKEKYFELVEQNHIFRNFKCSRCYLNARLEEKTDRIGWVVWAIWWFIKSQPGHFFAVKDIITVSLRSMDNKDKDKTCSDPLPMPPLIKTRPKNILSIYTHIQQTIYYACLY